MHVYYQRTLADRPVAGRCVRIELRARRLVRGNEHCARRTFAEQIPALTRRHARRTDALTDQPTDAALFLGGRTGARLFQRMGIDTCKDTLFPLIRALPLPSSGPVPHLGVDEFAVRRGRTYATRLYLHHRWMEGCTNASALTREIQRLGYRGDVNTVRRHLKPYRSGAIPATTPLPHLTVRRVTDWIMRRPERLTDVERKGLDELCERNPALATTVEFARRLALMVRDRRSEHLALDVWIADVRLDGQRELRTLANGMRRDRAAIQAALTTTYTSGASKATSPGSSC